MRISTAGNKIFPFTLIELVAAISIIALVSGLAVVSLRGESPAQLLERTVLEFQAFCARIRYLAAERGEEYCILYDPAEEGGIYALPAASISREEAADDRENDLKEPTRKIRFTPDKKIRIETAGDELEALAGGTELELFRFFPDGSGAGGRQLSLRCGELQKSFSVSRLTGHLLIEDREP